MPDWLLFLMNDVQQSFQAIQIKDFAIYGYLFLWIIILAFPLRGVDTHDHIAGLVYIIYMSGGGVVLFFALPKNFTEFSDFSIHLAAFIGMAIVAGYRWFHKNNQIVLSSEILSQQEEGNEYPKQ